MTDHAKEFVEGRIDAWESKHGMVSPEGRGCLQELLSGCLRINPEDAEAMMSKETPAGHEECHRLCFCERKKC